MKILFICSRNQWRSPTAEKVWSKVSGIEVRSAGTSKKARRKVTAKDLTWADPVAPANGCMDLIGYGFGIMPQFLAGPWFGYDGHFGLVDSGALGEKRRQRLVRQLRDEYGKAVGE